MAADPDTVPVTVTVLRIERVESGRLLALAEVEIDIAGVALVLHNIRVLKTGPRSRGIAAPCCRVANGRLADAVSLPPELAKAIANAVLDEYGARRRSPAPEFARPPVLCAG
jgi:DNA-binding cell septation regulator SpoVG